MRLARLRLSGMASASRTLRSLHDGDLGVVTGSTLEHLAHHVDRLSLRLVVRARLELREQPQGHQLHAGKHHQDAQQQHRAP